MLDTEFVTVASGINIVTGTIIVTRSTNICYKTVCSNFNSDELRED